jgi:hypothetical protein
MQQLQKKNIGIVLSHSKKKEPHTTNVMNMGTLFCMDLRLVGITEITLMQNFKHYTAGMSP